MVLHWVIIFVSQFIVVYEEQYCESNVSSFKKKFVASVFVSKKRRKEKKKIRKHRLFDQRSEETTVFYRLDREKSWQTADYLRG